MFSDKKKRTMVVLYDEVNHYESLGISVEMEFQDSSFFFLQLSCKGVLG